MCTCVCVYNVMQMHAHDGTPMAHLSIICTSINSFTLSYDHTHIPDIDPRHDVQDWISEDDLDLFNQYEAHSVASVQSADRSADNIVQRKSRVSSQENGKQAVLMSVCVSLCNILL